MCCKLRHELLQRPFNIILDMKLNCIHLFIFSQWLAKQWNKKALQKFDETIKTLVVYGVYDKKILLIFQRNNL